VGKLVKGELVMEKNESCIQSKAVEKGVRIGIKTSGASVRGGSRKSRETTKLKEGKTAVS